jgi:hypothetical protein
MTLDLFGVIVFIILVVGNLGCILFVYIPQFRYAGTHRLYKYDLTLTWVGLGISLGSIVACSMALGKLLYIVSGVINE